MTKILERAFLGLMSFLCLHQTLLTMSMAVVDNTPLQISNVLTDYENLKNTTQKEQNPSETLAAETGLPSGNNNNPYEVEMMGSSKVTRFESSNPLTDTSSNIHPAMKSTVRKRDAELEAESANGKKPIPFLLKRDFYHPNMRKFISSSNAKRGFSDFPPFSIGDRNQGVRYQRERRSFQSRQPDEMELNLENEREQEAFLRLMTFLATRETNPLSNYNLLSNNRGNDFLQEQDDEDLPIDLGYYGQHPGLYDGSDMPPMSSNAAETPLDLLKMGVHLSEVPESHGLYVSPQQHQAYLNGLDYENARKNSADDNDDWLDDAVPLQSNFKSRRSDSSLFRYNPAKSHFRRIQRAFPAEIYSSNGKFGPFYPQAREYIRKRRSSAQQFNYM